LQGQRAERSFVVVITPPVFKDHAAFAEGVEDFAVEALRTETTVETFGVTVLPGAPRECSRNIDVRDIGDRVG
jgi:hypothetical protein